MRELREKQKNDFRKHSRLVAFTAIFTGLCVVANLFSGDIGSIPFFGRVSLVYTTAFLSGIFLGPFYGGVASCIGDLIPAFALPQGAWIPLITVGTTLMAVIPALVFKASKNRSLAFKLSVSAVLVFFICTLGITAFGEIPLYHQLPYTTAKFIEAQFLKKDIILSPYIAIALSKAATQPFWIALNMLLTAALYKALTPVFRRFVPFTKPVQNPRG